MSTLQEDFQIQTLPEKAKQSNNSSLQVESRRDLSQKAPAFQNSSEQKKILWQFAHSQVDSEVVQSEHNYENNIGTEMQDQELKVNDIIDEIPWTNSLPLQKSEQKTELCERQFLILQNKRLSNINVMQSQIKQMIKLVNCSIYADQERELRNKISYLTAIVRRKRVRSLSGYKQINHNKNVGKFKIDSLKFDIKQMKKKYNDLNTRITLMDNFIKLNKNNQNVQQSQIRTSQHSQYQVYHSPKAKQFMSKYHQNGPILKQNDAFSQLLLQSSAKKRYNQKIGVLFDYRQILKQRISDEKQHTFLKCELIQRQKQNLKKQLSIIKTNIGYFHEENRISRSRSGKSIRGISFQRQNILNPIRFRVKSSSHAKLDTNRTSSLNKKVFQSLGPKNSRSSQRISLKPAHEQRLILKKSRQFSLRKDSNVGENIPASEEIFHSAAHENILNKQISGQNISTMNEYYNNNYF